MFRALQLPPTHRMRLLWGLLLLLVIVVGVRSARKATKGNDFGAYHAAARAVLSGDDIFDAHDSIDGRGYVYPPTLAVLATPLTVFSERVAGVVWVCLNLLALFWIYAVYRRRGRGKRSEALVWFGLASLVAFSYVDNNCVNGQVNLLVLAAIVLAWLWADSERWFASGLAIGLAACLKVTPLIFCGYFLFRRSGRGLGGVAVGVFVFTLVLPALVMGPGRALDTNREWVRLLTSSRTATAGSDAGSFGPDTAGERGPHQTGYSLRPFLYRWFTDSRITPAPDAPAINILSVDHAAMEWLYRLLALGLMAVAFLVGMRQPGSASDRFREFAIVCATMVLISPLSRKAHFVVLLPAALWIARTWWQTRDRRLLVGLGASLLFIDVAMYTGIATVKTYALGAGFFFLGGLALWIVLVLTPPPRAEPRAESSEAGAGSSTRP